MSDFVDLKDYGYSEEDIKTAEEIAIAAAKRFPAEYMTDNSFTQFRPHSWVVYAVLQALMEGWQD